MLSRTRSLRRSCAWLPYCGIVVGLSGAVACSRGGSTEPQDAAATTTVGQALTPEPAAPDANGNSPPDQELAFVPNMGFVDGTTCQTWPQTTRVDTQAPSGALPLAQVIDKFMPGSPEANVLSQIKTAFTNQAVSEISTVGSKNSLVVQKIDGKVYALDESAARGYDLSAQRFCTQSDVESGGCETISVATGTSSNAEILRRKAARSDVPTIMLVAPTVRVTETTNLDANFLVIANQFVGGGPVTDDLLQRPATVDINVQPYLDQTVWENVSAANRPGLFIAVAAQMGGIGAVTATSAGVETLYVTDADNPLSPDSSPHAVQMTPAQLLQLVPGTDANRNPKWTMVGQTSEYESGSMGDNSGGGYIKTLLERLYHADIAFKPLAPNRTAASQGGTVIIVAGQAAAGTSATAPGMQSTNLIYSENALLTYFISVLDQLNSALVEHNQSIFWGGSASRCIDLSSGYIDDLNSGAVWAPDYPGICHASKDNDRYWNCPPLVAGTSSPAANRVCLYPSSATWTIGDLTGNFYTVGNNYSLGVNSFTGGVINALRSYYGTHTSSGNAIPPTPGVPGTTLVSVGYPSVAANLSHILSRGVYFTELYHSADNASRRASVPNADKWQPVAKQTTKNILAGTYRDLNPSDTDLMQIWGVDPAKWSLAQTWKEYLDSSLSKLDIRLNALGLPYGRVATGWRSLSKDNAGSKTYLNLQARWGAVADLVDDLNLAAETQRIQGQVGDVSDDLASVIGGATTFIGQVGSASTALANAAGDNATLQDRARARLSGVTAEVTKNQTDLTVGIKTAWDCKNQDMSVCINNMNTMLQNLDNQCVQEGQSSFLGAILSTVAKMTPYVSTFATFISTTGIDKAVADAMKSDMSSVKEIIDAGESARKEVLEKSDAAASVKQFTGTIKDLVNAGLPNCGDKTLHDKAQLALTQMATLNGLVELYATNLETLQGIIDSLTGNIDHLLLTQQIYNGLKTSSDNALAALQQVGTTVAQNNTTIAADLASRRAFISAACQTALAANQVLQTDLYSVTQALQTTTGQSYTEPSLYVPAPPTYLNQGTSGTQFGYLVSLWEPSRFGRRLSSSGTQVDNVMARAHSRISTFWSEVCDPSGSSLPQTRFVVRKIIAGSDLDNLRTQGTAGVLVTLEDVIRGGNVPPDAVTAIAAQYQGTWNPLSAPVVLATAYAACTGPSTNPCGVGSRSELDTNPYLVKFSRGSVPTLTCGPTALTVTAAEPIHARARTCLAPVQVPETSWSMSYSDSLNQADQTVTTSLMDAACAVDVSVTEWGAGLGLPLVGPWTVAANQDRIDGSAAAATLPANVTAIEVAFVVGAEPAHANAELGSAVDTRAYSIEACTAEVLNNLDDDCDGVIDNGLIPATMAFETGNGGGAWTTTAPAVVSYTTARHTEGATALSVNAKGYATVTSANVMASALTQIGSVLLLDVYIPANQPNPNWLGAIGLSLSMPSQGINSVYLGNVNLTGLVVGGWNTISFPVSSSIQTTLLTKDGAVQYQISVNVPTNAPAVTIDNLRFGGNLKLRSSGVAVRSSLATILSFERLADWTGTNATLALDTNLISDGKSSLLFAARTSDYSTVTSAPIYASDFTSKKTKMLVDYAANAKPVWGSVQLTMQCPLLAGTKWVGYQSVVGLGANQYNTLTFALPSDVQTALIAPNSECNITLALSAPLGITYRFDNIRFQ